MNAMISTHPNTIAAIRRDRERGYAVVHVADNYGVAPEVVRELAKDIDMPEEGNGYVGKYDSLWVWEREDGLRYSVHLDEWVTEESGNFTSWLDWELDITDKEVFATVFPEGGQFVDINEA